MGYTHYWDRAKELDGTNFEAFVADCKKLCSFAGVPLGNFQGENEPTFSKDQVAFNGRAETDENCEPFYMPRALKPRQNQETDEAGRYFAFCKTRLYPYDLCVQGCLIALKHYFANDVCIHSDGGHEDWQPAAHVCQKALGYGLDFKLNT